MIYADSMGHCYSDMSLEELYDFCVKTLGLRPEWNHYSRDFPHFDLRDKAYLKRAIDAGAKPITNKEMVRLVRREDSPFKNFIENPDVPFYRDTFFGKPLTRIDFAAYFARKK